jgi:hypothetical protein
VIDCPSPGVLFPSAHSGEWVRFSRALPHPAPSAFGVRNSLGVFLPIPPPTHLSGWSALGILPSGLFTSPRSRVPFRRPLPSWRFTSQQQRPRPMTAGAVSRQGPWFPRVLTARSPSRLCSVRGARIHRVAVRPCDGSEPSWVSASLGSSPPPKQHGQMPYPPPSGFAPTRSLAGPGLRCPTAS